MIRLLLSLTTLVMLALSIGCDGASESASAPTSPTASPQEIPPEVAGDPADAARQKQR